jgi:4-hydroxy-3-methylbut-2-en-1-yl diphosphate synthase IspG/GcpE
VLPSYTIAACHGLLTHNHLLQIGPVKVGSEHRVALQTMTTTDTRDVAATVAQV